jgi:taspase (threonine aspartase 1)
VWFFKNSPLTNAGIGSNLTLDNKVECDASIMDCFGFGSVGALLNIQNPILVALSLLESQANGHLSYGRIAPCMLTGDGAKQWANNHNIPTVDDEALKTGELIYVHQV